MLRGPGSALFGASAVHGIVNVITPGVDSLPDCSARRRRRLGFLPAPDFAAGAARIRAPGFGAYGIVTRAPGWRDSSGVDEAQAQPARATRELGGGSLRLRAAGTVLNQETAGFIQGYDSYRDEEIAEDESESRGLSRCFERARSRRQPGLPATTASGRGLYRRSRMDFIQHFLIGKPFEHNAQTSYMLTGTASFPFDRLTARVSLDAETASSELTEFQPGPATDGAPAANAIRPAGCTTTTGRFWTLGITLSLEYRFSDRLTATAALRADQTNYDYDNLMIDGNTTRTACPAPARLSLFAPADRNDTFDNLAPRVTLAWRPMNTISLSERVDRFPAARDDRTVSPAAPADPRPISTARTGIGRARLEVSSGGMSLDLALFSMNKDNVILRETNGFNVGNGSTRHRGLEYESCGPAARRLRARRSPAPSRATNTRSRAPSRAARRSSRGTTWTRRRATCIR